MLLDLIVFRLTPSNLVTILLALGTFFLIFPKLRKLGCWLAVTGITLYFFAGCGPLTYYIFGQLEHRYPPLHHLEKEKPISAIVVLAGYGVTDAYFPPSSKVNDASLFRTVEAARLWHQSPPSRILLAGPSNATIAMADLLKALQIPDKAVERLPASRDTAGNIQSVKHQLQNKYFVLVTSAGHMPRSMLICQQKGLAPLPAPTDFYTSPYATKATWLPTPLHLRYTDLAIHEFLAILYLKIWGNNTASR
jgi:uncharacterized SAM-binding protein YcdF (DUF218 family)